MSPGWRHIKQIGDAVRKKKYYTQTAFQKCLNECELARVHSVLDWGPGSGWTSEMLSPETDIHLVDVSSEVIDVAKKSIPHATTDVIVDKPTFNRAIRGLIKKRFDMIISFSVIYHFPSFEYFEAIANCWRVISPEYIVIKTMITDVNTWERSCYKEYADSENFLRGLILSEIDLVSQFPEHKVIFRARDVDVIPGLLGKKPKKITAPCMPEYTSMLYVLHKVQ